MLAVLASWRWRGHSARQVCPQPSGPAWVTSCWHHLRTHLPHQGAALYLMEPQLMAESESQGVPMTRESGPVSVGLRSSQVLVERKAAPTSPPLHFLLVCSSF